MTETTNIRIMKTTMIIVATLLALVAAALVQGKAEAETAKVPTGSIEDAQEAGTNLSKGSGTAVKTSSQTQTSGGGISTRSTTIASSGRLGSWTLYPILAYPYYYGNQCLTTAGAIINRSPSYAGDQVITMRTRIYKRDVISGTYYPWSNWLSKSYSVRVGSYQQANMPRNWFCSSDIMFNEYVADVQVVWRTPGGTVLATQDVHLKNSWDYGCMTSSGCYMNGQEGQMRLWLHSRGGGI